MLFSPVIFPPKQGVVYSAASENRTCPQLTILNNYVWSMWIKAIDKRGLNFFLKERCTGKIFFTLRSAYLWGKQIIF